jgi:site-specific DNA-methyltransferase (adenine-specific)
MAIVDPPFGTGETWKKDSRGKFYHHESSYKNKETPGPEYFEELFRVSKRQIIFGANFYAHQLPERNSWIFWDKCVNQTFREAGQLIWTSFKYPARLIRLAWDGHNCYCPRIGNHPHEKPVSLYRRLLTEYAKPGWKILDTHLGSGTIALACIDSGLDLTASELDEKYYQQAMEVIGQYQAQAALFPQKETTVYKGLFDDEETD